MILFITCETYDYVSSIVYQGLVDSVGIDNLVAFPVAPFMRGGNKRFVNVPDMREWSREDVRRLVENGKIDTIVLCHCYYELNQDPLIDIFKHFKGKLAYINGSDSRGFQYWPIKQPDKYYQREVPIGDNVEPLLMAVTSSIMGGFMPFKDRSVDVFFSGALSSSQRWDYARLIFNDESLRNRKVMWSTDNFLPMEYYYPSMQKSKISLHIRGAGWDCMRLWELMGNGAFVMAEEPTIKLPKDFYEDGKEIVFFNKDNLTHKIRYYLDHQDEAEKIALAAREKTLKFHMAKNRAEQILKEIK